MNRDERPARGAASRGLFRGRIRGIDVSYPLDASSGGTWIGANSAGLFLALLNEYPAQTREKPTALSRGILIPAALGARDAGRAADIVERSDPGDFGPCVVVSMAPEGVLVASRSDGHTWMREIHPRKPTLFVSSGVDAEGARHIRGELFTAALERGMGGIEAFHRSHEPEIGPYSVCMHREGSRSVSLTSVSVGGGGADLRYWPMAPCEIGDSSPLTAVMRVGED